MLTKKLHKETKACCVLCVHSLCDFFVLNKKLSIGVHQGKMYCVHREISMCSCVEILTAKYRVHSKFIHS